MSKMTPFDEHEVKVSNGETLFYRKRPGGNKNLVLLHGNMSSSQNWDVLMNQLATDFTIYALDMRGFGDSSYETPIESIADLSDDLKLWAEELGLKKFILAGWSLGGNVAMQFSLDHKEMVEKLILVASGSIRGFPTPKRRFFGLFRTKEYLKTKEEIAKSVKLIEKLRMNESRRMIKMMFNRSFFTHKQPNEARHVKYQNAFFNQRSLPEVNYALAHFNISNDYNGVTEGNGKVKDLDVETLILHGKEDHVVAYQVAEDIYEHLDKDKTQLKLYDQAGHALVLDKTEAISEDFFEFVIGDKVT